MIIYYLGTENSRRQLEHALWLPACTIFLRERGQVVGRRGPAVLFLSHDSHCIEGEAEIRDHISTNHNELEIIRLRRMPLAVNKGNEHE